MLWRTTAMTQFSLCVLQLGVPGRSVFHGMTCQRFRFRTSRGTRCYASGLGAWAHSANIFLDAGVVRTLDGQFLFVLECPSYFNACSIGRPCPLTPTAASSYCNIKKKHLPGNYQCVMSPGSNEYNVMLPRMGSWFLRFEGTPGIRLRWGCN